MKDEKVIKVVKVLCVKTMTMIDSEGEIAFIEGKEYTAYLNDEGELFCTETECETTEINTVKHIIRDHKHNDLEDFFHEYFKVIEE